jgi:hypothetical protein
VGYESYPLRDYCKRPILWLASSKILTPTPSLGGEGGGGGVNILEDVRHSSVLYVCKYFVVIPHVSSYVALRIFFQNTTSYIYQCNRMCQTSAFRLNKWLCMGYRSPLDRQIVSSAEGRRCTRRRLIFWVFSFLKVLYFMQSIFFPGKYIARRCTVRLQNMLKVIQNKSFVPRRLYFPALQ